MNLNFKTIYIGIILLIVSFQMMGQQATVTDSDIRLKKSAVMIRLPYIRRI